MNPSKSSSSENKPSENTPSKDIAVPSQTQSLEDIRKQVVKFIMADDDTSRTVNVASCTSGVEVLERVLKKFGKWNEVTASVSTDDEFDENDDYLQVDGWGLYTERYPNADCKCRVAPSETPS
jgi:mitogen-activated protein kinase kinase kinase